MSDLNRPELLGRAPTPYERYIGPTYDLTIHQAIAWHDLDGDGSVVRAEILKAAAGRPVYDLGGVLLANHPRVEQR